MTVFESKSENMFKPNALDVIVLVASLVGSHCRPSGNIEEACDDMTPGHNSPSQDVDPPYEISVGATEYTGGDTIMITMLSPNGDPFKGFFLQARRIADDKRIGYFTAVDNRTQLLCSKVIRTHPNPKDAFT